MKSKLEHLLNLNCVYIEINLKNNDSFSIYKPNQESGDEIELLDNMIKWNRVNDDGCTFENYFLYDAIAFVTGIYNCPKLLEEENV